MKSTSFVAIRVVYNLFFLAKYYMTRTRCTGTTRRGTPCQRNARQGEHTCASHATTAPQCPVCLADMSVQTCRTLECGHTFHTRCLDRWKRTSRTCPMCRTPFDQPLYKVHVSVQRVADNATSSEMYTTSNISNMVSMFGIDPLLDPRLIAEILFEVGAHESISHMFHDLGIRVPDAPFVLAPVRAAPPRT